MVVISELATDSGYRSLLHRVRAIRDSLKIFSFECCPSYAHGWGDRVGSHLVRGGSRRKLYHNHAGRFRIHGCRNHFIDSWTSLNMASIDSNRLASTPGAISVNRKIPDYRIDFWQQKTSHYCLIIPVINEGDRIRAFIRRLNQHSVPKLVDIIIVDGGTTDGSLEKDYLLDSNIRGMLTKLGAGKLSAQLRVAYAFALEHEYAGIITIDGNNKDDPSAIKDFVEALDQGYDFVQASRFVPGGRHNNTPLSRYLAIKLIHAPVLSMASGFSWTDTTQGFRAYSSRALIDDRVSPFRDIFIDYELLAYLSYRLPKLHYRCIELPTVRDYPEGKVPTKISAFKGNFALIKTLAKTCLGAFNP